MAIQAIIDGVAQILSWVLSIIPNMNMDTAEFIKAINDMVEMSKAMNVIFPIAESLVLTGILISLKLAFMLLYAATRAINLIRGAG